MLQHLPSPWRTSRRRRAGGVALLACTCLVSFADDAAMVRRQGSPLDKPVEATWSGVPLRTVAARLTEISGLPIVIDRRLDPDSRVTIDAVAEPLDEVLRKVAAAAGGSVAFLHSHVRIAAPGTATSLAAVEGVRSAEIRALDGASRKRAMDRRPWRWSDGARPRDLVTTAAAEAGIAIDGIDALPHDHFPGAELPEMTLADRLDLVLAHFDRRIMWQNRARRNGEPPTFAIVPIDAIDAGNEASTTTTDAGKQPGARPPQPPAGATYSLRVEAPLDELLATLSKRFGLALELDREALRASGIAAGEIVRRTVENASREAVLDAILEPLGLSWRIEGTTLEVGGRR